LDWSARERTPWQTLVSTFQETLSSANPIGLKGVGESDSMAAPPTLVHVKRCYLPLISSIVLTPKPSP
jgi:carbon-monoxide dehydrogenase large subunit